jgi:hypothetical protein
MSELRAYDGHRPAAGAARALDFLCLRISPSEQPTARADGRERPLGALFREMLQGEGHG